MRKVGSMFSHHFFCFYLRRVILIVAVAFLGFSFVPQIGLAQQDLPVPDAPSIRKMIGIVGVVLPDYVGSDDYTVVPAPLFTYKFMGERYFKLLGNRAFVNVLNHPNWEFGAKAVYRFGRDDDVDDPVVSQLDEVDDSFELGGFIGYGSIIGGDVRHRYNVHLDITQDISDGHDGYIIELSGAYWRPVAKAFDIGLRVASAYASDDYMSAYYDVSPQESIRTGLPVFNADGGLDSVRFGLMGLMHLSFNWHIGAGAFYGRLLGDVEDSPVVDIRGDANQFIGGISAIYSW